MKARTLVFVLVFCLLLGAMVWVQTPNPAAETEAEDWFYPYITESFRFGLTTGIMEDTGLNFHPHRNVTRAEFITMLGRLHEYSGTSVGPPDDSAFYARYLTWAVETGIFKGDLNGNLRLHSFITRQEMALMLHRYITIYELQEHFDFEAPPVAFHDWTDSAPWAQEAVLAMGNYALMHGDEHAHFRPLDTTSRAEALAVLVRLGNILYG